MKVILWKYLSLPNNTNSQQKIDYLKFTYKGNERKMEWTNSNESATSSCRRKCMTMWCISQLGHQRIYIYCCIERTQ